MNNGIKLRAPLEVSRDDVKKALFEHAQDEPMVARAAQHVQSAAAAAADELNRALDVDIFEMLAHGWAKVPAVRNAVQLSALVLGPPAIVNLDEHKIASTSRVVLDSSVAHNALPPLNLVLEIVAGVQSATLAARDGRVELVALGKASIIARLKYKNTLLKEHATGVEGGLRDPFKRQPSAPDPQAGVDIQI